MAGQFSFGRDGNSTAHSPTLATLASMPEENRTVILTLKCTLSILDLSHFLNILTQYSCRHGPTLAIILQSQSLVRKEFNALSLSSMMRRSPPSVRIYLGFTIIWWTSLHRQVKIHIQLLWNLRDSTAMRGGRWHHTQVMIRSQNHTTQQTEREK